MAISALLEVKYSISKKSSTTTTTPIAKQNSKQTKKIFEKKNKKTNKQTKSQHILQIRENTHGTKRKQNVLEPFNAHNQQK